MSRAIRPLPQYVSMVWCSVKVQGQLYLYLFFYLVSLFNFHALSDLILSYL